MKWFIVLFVFTAGVSASALEYTNLKQFPVDHPQCKGFVVITEKILQYRLYYVSPENSLEVFPELPSELYPESIDTILLSPGKDKVLFLSHGEGHPRLNIYRMNELLQYADEMRIPESWDKKKKAKIKKLRCVADLDPYPGTCSEPRWADNDDIQFEAAGVDFSSFDKKTRRGNPLTTNSQSRIWCWNIVKDTFEPANP